MAGVAAVLVAFLLGCIGPKFLWRGGAWLLLSVLVIGFAATAEMAYRAPAEGMEFIITPWSFLVGLSEQLFVASACYAFGAVSSIGTRRIKGSSLPTAEAEVSPKIEP